MSETAVEGRVLEFDAATGKGIINGEDGNRYEVTWGAIGAGVRTLIPGMMVDFEVDDGRAVDIFPLADEFQDQKNEFPEQKNKGLTALLAFLFGSRRA
jgi:cold shock CspA family protein